MKKFIWLLIFLSELSFGATGTLYAPDRFVDLQSSMLQGFGQGVHANCAALTTTNIDLTLTDDVLITGLVLLTNGGTFGDYIDLQVMAGASVVASPVSTWYIPMSDSMDFNMVFPIKVVAGLKLRIVCHSTNLLIAPSISVNYKLWKILY